MLCRRSWGPNLAACTRFSFTFVAGRDDTFCQQELPGERTARGQERERRTQLSCCQKPEDFFSFFLFFLWNRGVGYCVADCCRFSPPSLLLLGLHICGYFLPLRSGRGATVVRNAIKFFLHCCCFFLLKNQRANLERRCFSCP